MGPGMLPLQDLQFEHTALTSLPVDENEHREVQRDLPGACFSLVDAQPLDGPEVVCLSQSALDLLGVKVDEHDPSLPKLLSLSATFSNCKTYAHCYCGHQFGSFAGMPACHTRVSLLCTLECAVLPCKHWTADRLVPLTVFMNYCRAAWGWCSHQHWGGTDSRR